MDRDSFCGGMRSFGFCAYSCAMIPIQEFKKTAAHPNSQEHAFLEVIKKTHHTA
jgi:hypothetical protein